MPIEGHNLSPTMKIGFIPIDISAAKIVSSTGGEDWSSLNAGLVSSAAYKITSTSARLARLTWSSASAVQYQLPGVVLPPDFTSLSAPVFNLLGGPLAVSTADQAPLFNVTATLSTGSSGGTGFNLHTIAMTQASTVPSLHSVSLNSSVVAAYPNVLTFLLGITSTQNGAAVAGAWLTYTKAQRG